MMAATVRPGAELLAAARRYFVAGLSPFPVKGNGTKAPGLPKGHEVLLRKRRATDEELSRWFAPGRPVGIAVSCGSISGGLAVVDFDDPDTFGPWLDVVEHAAPGLVARLVQTQTPRRSQADNPGVHLAARVEGDPLKGGSLAGSKATGKARIEVRGDGSYVVVPPSNGGCHESGRPWVHVEGSPTLEEVPKITRDEWEILVAAARSFDERPVEVPTSVDPKARYNGDLRPGDDFAARGDVRALLTEAGAIHVYARGEVEYWRRPGKERGVSATLGFHKTDAGAPCLHVFSSSWLPFEAGRSYSPFAAYTFLKHGGDFTIAAKALARDGYGAKAPGAVADENPGALRADDIGIGQRFAQRHSEMCRYSHTSKEWWIWDGKRWKSDDVGRTQVLAKETARNLLTEAREQPDDRREAFAKWAARCQSGQSVREILRMAESELPVTMDEFDVDPLLLNCANGILDLDLTRNPSGVIRPHDPRLMLARFTPVEFDPDQTIAGTHWIRFLDEVVPDKDVQGFLQVFCGYSLTGITKERLFVLLYGRGRNGKSTFLDAFSNVIGDYARNAEFKTFLKKQNDAGVRNGLARLAGARMITAVEPPESSRSCFDESTLKIFTGGTDKITAAEVYQKEVEFTPQGKLWLATNHEPNVSDTTDSFWDRIIKVPFAVRVERIDRDLPAKLRAESSVILAWAWQGLRKWQQDGFIRVPDVLRKETSKYRESTDPVQTWIDDRCSVGPSAKAAPRALFNDFRSYASEAGLGGPENETAFGRALTDKGFISKSVSKARFRIGLRLLTTPVQAELEQRVQQV